MNDHIYSIDVFMREKEQQSEQLQKDKDTLLSQIAHLRGQLLDSSERPQTATIATETEPMAQQQQQQSSYQSEYERFLAQLHTALGKKTRALGDFLRFVQCVAASSSSSVDADAVLGQIDVSLTDAKRLSPVKVTPSPPTSSGGLVDALNGLLQSSELHHFNAQIVTYMGEQLIHKAALNGYLKFACDLLRKKLVC